MNCDEVQQLSPLWLSAELDGAAWRAFEAHLANCERCTASMEEQAALDRRIAQALRAEDPCPLQTVQAVKQRIAMTQRRRRWFPSVGIAAALVLAVLGRPGSPPALLKNAARDHRLEVMEHQPRRWRTDPVGMAAMAERFGLTASKLTALRPAGFRLMRAKTCGLEGQPALHLVFAAGARELSVYITRSGSARPNNGAIRTENENVASYGNSRYSAVVVDHAGGRLDECRQIARHTASLL